MPPILLGFKFSPAWIPTGRELAYLEDRSLWWFDFLGLVMVVTGITEMLGVIFDAPPLFLWSGGTFFLLVLAALSLVFFSLLSVQYTSDQDLIHVKNVDVQAYYERIAHTPGRFFAARGEQRRMRAMLRKARST
jgi:hypothetical protein